MTTAPAVTVADYIKNIEWRRFFNFAKWRRWFGVSIYQSGRLTTLLALILVFFLRVEDPQWLQFLRAKTFDTYQQIKPRTVPADSPVIIVDIDEKSIAELGQWQWPRTLVATLIDQLTALNVKVIGLDVVFSEPDRTSPALIADSAVGLDKETQARLRKLRNNDDILAEAIAKSERVVLGQPISDDTRAYNEQRPATSFVAVGADPDKFMEKHDSMLRNLLVLDEAAEGHGVFALSSTFIDGIARDVPMVSKIGGVRNPSLAVEMLRVSKGAKSIQVKTDENFGIQELMMRPRGSRDYYKVPTDARGILKVYYAPHAEYQKAYVSAVDVIKGRVDPARFADKLILVGTSAQALRDVRSTPLDAVLPGVEVHANVLENIIYGTPLLRSLEAESYEILAALGIGLIIIIITPMVNARWGAITFIVLSGSLVAWSWNEFDQRRELFDPVFPIIVAFLFYSFLTFAAFTREESQKKQIRGAFGQYLSPAVVEQLAENPSQLKLGGENREMSFMFSDIRGFTSISELFDAEGLTRLINRLLTPLSEMIMNNNGTIDKYMGDCVMAFWNAPLPVPNHPRDACISAFQMITALKELNAELEAEAKAEQREHRPLNIGIGINTGIACVGNMGSARRFGYSVLGDAVNLASRLEGQSKSYGVTIVIGETTAAKVPEFAILELDLIKVKGKTEAVRIHTLVGQEEMAQSAEFKSLRACHDSMLKAYRAQRWDEAEKLIGQCRALAAKGTGLMTALDDFYDIYAERITENRASPPPTDWDGVYVATSK